MHLDDKIYIAGHKGLVGSALMRKFIEEGYSNIITRTHNELDLTDQASVRNFFMSEKPDYVLLAAAKVGGIVANNTYPAEFIYKNLSIQTNVIHASYELNVKKLLFLGSSCIYPRDTPQPMKEEYLLTGKLEQTNEAYAIAKISGIKMCAAYNRQYGTDYLCVMPTNLYGPNDNYDLHASHVMPALIRKIHAAKEENKSSVEIWGTGKPRREFMHCDDLADACHFLMNNYSADTESEFLNIGTGEDISIKMLAELIAETIGYSGTLEFNHTYPDGTPRKLLDIAKVKQLGWFPKIKLRDGLIRTYNEYKKMNI